MSRIAWIDFDPTEQERMRRILSTFEEREARDELGLGAVRDSIADHLFPGISTIQTRLRYMLFVPWIYTALEAKGVPSSRIEAAARADEIKLSTALAKAPNSWGLFGRDAGANLRRMPSSVYWTGLGSWGIRRFSGSMSEYHQALDLIYQRRNVNRRMDDGDWERDDAAVTWHPDLPTPPNDLLTTADFRLKPQEAEFLRDCIVKSHSQTLLAYLVLQETAPDCPFIWAHPEVTRFPPALRTLVRDAELFSAFMHGAALLYNLILAELAKREERVAEYREKHAAWERELDRTGLECWSLTEFWDRITHPSHRISPHVRHFVTDWIALIRNGFAYADSLPARRLVEQRERSLKREQSRITNAALRVTWSGQAGAYRLVYRWPQVKSLVGELCNAL